ncbi:MAG: ABC transporter permease subunit [Candidatus Heimdallarchaeaceae archaeon]
MDKSVAVSLKIVGFILIFTAAFVPLYGLNFSSTSAEPEPIVLVDTQIIANDLTAVYYDDGFAYVLTADAGLIVVNVTDPIALDAVGIYSITGSANGIFVNDSVAYIADTNTGLQTVNITDPTTPTSLGSYGIAGGANNVFIAGEYAYVVDSTVGLQILDVSTPATPTQEGTYSISGDVNGVVVREDVAYVVDSTVGLHILNVSDPTDPVLIGTYEAGSPVYDVDVQGNYAYIVGENFGLQSINITSLDAPLLGGQYQVSGIVNEIDIDNEHVYIVDSSYGLHIVSIIDPTNLYETGIFETPTESIALFVMDGYAYVAESGTGLEVYSVRPRFNRDSFGNLVEVYSFSVDYKLITYDTHNNVTQSRFLQAETPSSVIILAAAIWFSILFALMAIVLGQVFQSGELKSRAIIADIAGGILLLVSLVAAVLAMNRSIIIAAGRYEAIVTGQDALTLNPITFNPNDSNPAYFDIALTGTIEPGFYIFVIGVFIMLTGLFLPVDWQKPTGSTMTRKIGKTSVVRWIKTVASLRLTTYITRRLLTLIPLFIAICVMTFVMVSGMGDPVALLLLGKQRVTEADRINLTRKLGLDQPIYVQFVVWFYNLLHGDMGTSFQSGQSINDMIGGLVWETLKLQIASFTFALLIAIPLGVLAAKNQNSWIDSAASAFALLGLSMPIFVFGLLLIYIFSGYGLGWFPAAKAHRIPTPTPVFSNTNWELFWGGNTSTWWANVSTRLADSIMHMVLPTIALTFASIALYTRLVRSTMLEVLRQDYILSARANGLSERAITWRHAFRNVLIPVVTYVGLFLASALAGAPITETLFSWPGLGFKYVSAVNLLDFPMILGTTALLTILILLGNLLTDIAYVAVDPRIEL